MKKIIAIILSLTMTAALCACSENNDTHNYENAAALGVGNAVASSSEVKSASDLSQPETEAVTTTTTTALTTVTEPETTTQQTTTAPPETTTTTTTTTTAEPPQPEPSIYGSAATMNDSVILNVTGDPNSGVITLDIENNSDGALILFGMPTLVVDGYSVSLDRFANISVMSNEVPANAKGLIELKAQPDQIKSGMRVTGKLFSKNLRDFSDKGFDITLE